MTDDIRTQRVNAPPPEPADEKTRRVVNKAADAAPDETEIGTRRVAALNGNVAPDEAEIGTRRVAAPSSHAEPQETAEEEIVTRHVTATSIGAARGRDGRRASLGFVAPDTTICDDCVVIQTHHNHESARPGLYECQAPEGRVMVKVAATEFPPQRDLWDKLPHLRHPHVLKTFRVIEDEHFYEVQEFCSAGTLAERVPTPGSERATPSLAWIENDLVPSFLAGISYLHEHDVVHRDIKPANLYLREQNGKEVIVIGDFDISSVLQSGRTSRSTERAAGTWNYSPPEAFPRFIDEEASRTGGAVTRSSDFYSFGVVLVELLLGTTSLHQARLPDLYDFYLQGGRIEIPDDLPERLALLLHGLLLRNRNGRWGAAEVGRWLKNQTTEADRKRIRDDSSYELGRNAQPFTAFDQAKPRSLAQMADAMASEPEIALDELMSGDVMLNWIGNLDARVAREIRRDRETWRAQPPVALVCAMLRCDASHALPIAPNYSAHDAQEWAIGARKAVEQEAIKPAELCSEDGLQRLETWLRLKANAEPAMAERVAAVRAQSGRKKLALSEASVALEELEYAFLPDKPYTIAPDVCAGTPQQIARLTYGQSADWEKGCTATYATARERWEGGYLQAWLRQRQGDSPLVEQCQDLRKKFADEPAAGFETTLRLLDPQLPPVQIELDAAPVGQGVLAVYGDTTTRSLKYRTVGPGIPHGALHLEGALPGLQLGEHQLRKRQGQVELRLESRNEIPVSRPFQALIKLESPFTQLAGGELTVPYGVSFPTQKTLLQIAAGASLGAALMGGARWIIMSMIPYPVTTNGLDKIWSNTASGNVSSGSLFVAALVIAGFGYAGFRLWMWALKNHASA